MISALLITVERLNSGKCRPQRPNHVELNANRLFSIYYFFNQLLCCLLKKAKFYFPPTRDGAVQSLISRHPHHIVAAACVYLCACVQWVHNLSIYVCVSVCVRESTAQDAVRLSMFQPPVHTHTPPPTTNYKPNLNFGKGPRFTESSHSRGVPDHFQQAEQKCFKLHDTTIILKSCRR